MPTGVREVRRGDVSLRMLYDEHAVEIACARHDYRRVVSLDAAAFGRELVAFFHDHEECSAGAPAVVVDLDGTTGRRERVE